MALVRQTRPEKLRLDEAIQRFKASLDPPYMTKFEALKTGPAPKPSDVFRLTEEVNRDGHKIHRTWRQYGSRLQKALDQVVIFTKVGDILVGGSQNMIACGVWAAVRLSIQIATGYLSFFDKVSSLWMNIGRSCEVQEELVQLFPQSTELQTLMSEYLVVTVNFCQRIVAFSKRPLISKVTSTFTITFDKEFKEFETQLGYLAKLMNQRAKVLTAQATLESSKTLTTASKLLAIGSLTARKRDYEKRRANLLKRLCPFQERFDRRQRHERKRGDVKRRPSVLSGNIGSGKTVAAANIISALQAYEDPQSTAVAGFFCRGDDPRTLEADMIIGSLVHQLVRSLGPTAERAINRYTPENSTPSEVIDTTLKALPKDRHYFIVIDALDECDTDTIIEVATKLASGAHADLVVGGAQINLTVESLGFSCLYTCRVDSPMLPVIKKLFSPTKTRSNTGVDLGTQIYHISMSDPGRDHEIEAYITSEIAARREIRNLSPELEAAVTAALIAGAQGMFLWVALQLEIIFPRYHATRILTDKDLTMLLEMLLQDLEAAYNKALDHIFYRKRSKQVFQLVAGCERPLTTGELAVAANVKPGNIFWDHSTFPLDPSSLVWTCGGGLLEVMEEEDNVHYIHHSAMRHLLLDGRESMDPASTKYAQGPPWALGRPSHVEQKFMLEDAGTIVAAICVTYLSYPMHDSRLAERINVADDRDILEVVSGSIARNQAAITSGSLTNRLISRVLDRRKQPVPQSSGTTTGIFNLVNSLARQEHQDEYETATKLFLEYASCYWLHHTKHFMDPSDSDFSLPTPFEDSEVHSSPRAVVPDRCYQLFRSLVKSNLAHIGHPWPEETDIARAEWALKFGHVALLNTYTMHFPYIYHLGTHSGRQSKTHFSHTVDHHYRYKLSQQDY
ncbi:hypothetical protein V8F06_004854 [Rhypophila decipiens]